ncbi:MAG: nickel pincer cofactor biosynthesis protein LarC, partial [Candidatus Korobacteraceae bacterium]
TVRGLDIGASLDIRDVDRNGISSTKVDVLVDGQKDLPREEFLKQQEDQHNHQHEHAHPLEHAHEHDHQHGHSHEHGHAHEHAHGHQHPHRGLKQIREIIRQAAIPDAAKQTATAVFQALGEVEAKIHHQDVETIEFHEVGSVDAIVDIVCAAVGADALRVDRWVSSPLNVGGGVVKCAHGTLPVPAPATLELLKNAPVYSSGVQKELVTPTGAAIVRTLAADFGSFPSMKVEAVGYGAGGRDLPGMPNVTRLTVGESIEERRAAQRERVTVLEANLDDMSPQVFGYVIDRLLEAGALDVFATPVQMKKSRPGLVLTVLARNQDVERLSKLIFAETTTLGMRLRQEQRLTLERQHVAVTTPWGEVRVKIGSLDGAVCNAAPEFEDCRRLAAAHNVPLKRVMQEALRSYFSRQDQVTAPAPPAS